MSDALMRDIIIVGSGNVASHLAEALKNRIRGIYSRNVEHARAIAPEEVPRCGILTDICCGNNDIIIFSIADHALGECVEAVKNRGKIDGTPLVLHTSGSMPKEILESLSTRTGVLYPLQSFSKNVYVDMASVPFFTESAVEADLSVVDTVAYSISRHVYHADAAHRATLHIAGVFSSNFTNALLDITSQVLAKGGYPLEVVKPLVEATVAKAFSSTPFSAQTGPALRGDKCVMEKQQNALDGIVADIYEVISKYIVETHQVKVK